MNKTFNFWSRINLEQIIFFYWLIWFDLIWFIVFNATFSNTSAMSWRPVLVVEEAGVPPTMDKQLVIFITCGCGSSALFFFNLHSRARTSSIGYCYECKFDIVLYNACCGVQLHQNWARWLREWNIYTTPSLKGE